MSYIIALDASEWQGELSRLHFQYAYNMGARLYIAQLFGSGPTGLGANDFADEQLGFAKDVGMALAGYIWVPPDNTTKTESLVKASLDAAGEFAPELSFVAPDLEGGRLHPTNPVGRLMDVCQNLVLANKRILIYNRKGGWPTVMGPGVTEFSQWALWEARYYFNSGFKPVTPPDIDWRWTKYGGWQRRAILQYAGTAPVKDWSADWNIVALDRLGFDLYELGGKPTPVPQPKPTPKPTPPPPPPPRPKPPAGTREYVVKVTDGDGLSGIAGRELGNAGRWPEIAALNPNVKSPRYVIHKGDILLLPTGRTPAPKPKPKPKPRPGTRRYVVKKSDGAEGLSGIASRELGDATRWREIARLNGLKTPFTIHARQVLLLPTDRPAPTPKPRPSPKPRQRTHKAGHEAVRGLWGIAATLGITRARIPQWIDQVKALNGWTRVANPVIHVGDVIKIP